MGTALPGVGGDNCCWLDGPLPLKLKGIIFFEEPEVKRRKKEEVVDPLPLPFPPLLPPLLLEVVAETVVLVVMVDGAIVVVELLLLLLFEVVLFNERPIRLDLRSITDTFCDSLRHCKREKKNSVKI